jgi:hypothetical protein
MFHGIKIKLIKEALRALKSGNEFVFLDLYIDGKIIGDKKEPLNELKNMVYLK